ncbi:RidA family protein, partial [Serratia bockelmannii]
MSKVVRKNYPQLGEVKAPYVHSVTHGNTLYI